MFPTIKIVPTVRGEYQGSRSFWMVVWNNLPPAHYATASGAGSNRVIQIRTSTRESGVEWETIAYAADFKTSSGAKIFEDNNGGTQTKFTASDTYSLRIVDLGTGGTLVAEYGNNLPNLWRGKTIVRAIETTLTAGTIAKPTVSVLNNGGDWNGFRWVGLPNPTTMGGVNMRYYAFDPGVTTATTTLPTGHFSQKSTENLEDNAFYDWGGNEPSKYVYDGFTAWVVFYEYNYDEETYDNTLVIRGVVKCRMRPNVAPINLGLYPFTAKSGLSDFDIGTLAADDLNETDEHTFTLLTGEASFYIAANGKTLRGSAGLELGSYLAGIRCSDGMAQFEKSVDIEIIDGSIIAPTDFTAVSIGNNTVRCSFTPPEGMNSPNILWQQLKPNAENWENVGVG